MAKSRRVRFHVTKRSKWEPNPMIDDYKPGDAERHLQACMDAHARLASLRPRIKELLNRRLDIAVDLSAVPYTKLLELWCDDAAALLKELIQ